MTNLNDDVGDDESADSSPATEFREVELLRQACEGDVASLDQFFERNLQQFQQIAARELGAHYGDAESVVQSVFVTVREKCHQCRAETEGELRAWIAQILRNRARDRLRLLGRTTPLVSSDSTGELPIPTNAPGPSTVLMNREMKQFVEAAVQMLPALDREVIRLHFFEKLPFREVAIRQNSSEAAVKQRCSRAIHKLRNLLCDKSGSINSAGDCATIAEAGHATGGIHS